MSLKKSLLLVGACGNLGRSVAKNFKTDWSVASIDIEKCQHANQTWQLDVIARLLSEKVC